MACLTPITAYQDADGTPGWAGLWFNPSTPATQAIPLNCGKCILCRRRERTDLMIRAAKEGLYHHFGCSITLTYETVPVDGSLDHTHIQQFFKKLRHHVPRFSYLVAGEYGPKTLRPHYHVLLYGWDFPDRTWWRQSHSGLDLFRSPLLEADWGHGYAPLTPGLSESAAAYVSSYVQKKALRLPETIDYDTGVVHKPEYAIWSRRPALGKRYYDQFKDEIYSTDSIVVGGRVLRPPRYYDDLLAAEDPDRWEDIKDNRVLFAQRDDADTRPEHVKTATRARIAERKAKHATQNRQDF